MNILKLTCVTTLLLISSACSEVERGRSFASPDSPRALALNYFHAIYNKTDLQEALSYTSKSYANSISHYATAKSYARNVLNLKFDKGVEINIDRSLSQIQQDFNENKTINVLFSGFYQGNKLSDIKRVEFVKKNDKWFIDDVTNY